MHLFLLTGSTNIIKGNKICGMLVDIISAGAKRLARGFSAPCILRPSLVAQPLSPKIQDDHLGLPPIPEASTPITPIMPKLIETSVEERQEDHILNEKH
ncbi:hypothetical protein Q1695_012360 [Nippostrongylus brasiliensis]|nr:hypothetical protein Q1695_012360 [Nippostrongylus brasiliensis]